MPDRPDGFGAKALTPLRQMKRGPFLDQRVERQRCLGAFALGLGPSMLAFGLGGDLLRAVGQPTVWPGTYLRI